MSKPILGKAYGGEAIPESPRYFCWYYRHKPYKQTILCEDCEDYKPCTAHKPGSGDKSKPYYAKMLSNKPDHDTPNSWGKEIKGDHGLSNDDHHT